VSRVVLRLLALVALVGALVGTTSPPAGATELVTDYPAVSLRPGDTATFVVRVVSPARERVGLAVGQAPDGWAVRVLGSGREVGAVFADPDPDVSPTVDVEVDVPVDAGPGTYAVVLTADAASGATTLSMDITVTALASAPFELSADFPQLSGAPDQTFTFDVDVSNNTGRDATFAIEAIGPASWDVSARPTGEAQATTLTVGGGEDGTLSVSATPPPGATAGDYPIDVTVTADGVPVQGQFTATIVGTPTLVFAPTDDRLSLDGDAGDETTFSLVVENTGSAPLTDVTLSGSAPQDWDVTFEPASVASIEPGQSVPVTAHIRPQGDAVSGDYSVTLSASSGSDRQDLAVRFQVQTSTLWGFIAVALIVVALVALAVVFRRFGRR
jgi:uncharacterized membrane protein